MKNPPECLFLGACRLTVEYPVGKILSAGTHLNQIIGGLTYIDLIIVKTPILKQQTGKI